MQEKFKIEKKNQQQKTITAAKIILNTPSPLNPSMKQSSADYGSFEDSSAGRWWRVTGPVIGCWLTNALIFNTADGLKFQYCARVYAINRRNAIKGRPV